MRSSLRYVPGTVSRSYYGACRFVPITIISSPIPIFRLVVPILLFAALSLSGPAVAQSSSSASTASDSTAWYIEASTGYYTQEGNDASGLGVFVNVGRRLNTGFIGSLGFGIAQTYHRYPPTPPVFRDDQYYRTHYIFRLSFDYPFELAPRHRARLGTGIVYVQRYWTRPLIGVREGLDGQVLVSGGSNPVTPNVAGLHFTGKYEYRLSRVALGLRADGHLFQFERGGEFIVAPFITVQF